MSPQYYSILHVASILLLTGVTFAVFGGAPESRRKTVMMAGGILSLLALVGGFGLASKTLLLPNPLNWPLWVWVKVLCWLWLSAVGGIAFRRRAQTARWIALTAFALIVALAMVYLRPTFGA